MDKRFAGRLSIAFMIAMVFGSVASAQTRFVYVNNASYPESSVSGFSMDANGKLTPVPGSPFMTAGKSSLSTAGAPNRVVVSPTGKLLFVANDGSRDISVFSIDVVTGRLSAIPGSPFPTEFMDTEGMRIAITPDGAFLIVAAYADEILRTYAIASDGTLTPVVAPPFVLDGWVACLNLTPDGQFVILALFGFPSKVISVRISSDGSLSASGGPAILTPGRDPFTMAFNCGGDLLFVGEAMGSRGSALDILHIDSGGALSSVSGSPFTVDADNNFSSLVLTPNEQYLFAGLLQSNTTKVYRVVTGGGIQLVLQLTVPAGSYDSVATDSSGIFLIGGTIEEAFILRIDETGFLTLTDNQVTRPFGVASVAVYPPKQCALTITDARIEGKKLLVSGQNLDSGSVILINGADQRTRNDAANWTTLLIAKKGAKSIPPGQTVSIQVRTSNGRLSNVLSFNRPVAGRARRPARTGR